MKTKLITFICCLISVTAYTQNYQEIVDGNNKFAFQLYRQLESGNSKNLFYSPWSISTALAMTYAGARNETATQIEKTLNFKPGEKFHSRYRFLIHKLDEATIGKMTLKVANGLWAQEDFKFDSAYFNLIKANYISELKSVNFIPETEREQVRKEINNWVERRTNHKIKDLISYSDLDSRTRLVLVNAIYFLASWDKPFLKEGTEPAKFFLLNKTNITVPFMSQKSHYGYYEDSALKVLEIPYSDQKASMVIFLPMKNDGIKNLEKVWRYSYYQEIMSKLQPDDEWIYLPKFETTYKTDLNKELSKMGMPLAFSESSADFSGMTGKRDLYISDVIHQAFIRVDEEGTEAAAATAVTMRCTAAYTPQAKIFKADHPFIFLIRENTTGSILFIGKINNPALTD